MQKVLTEWTKFEGEIIKEEKSSYNNGKPKLTMKGILQRADTLNQNGRIYPKKILEKELRNYQKLIRERRATGSLDHTDSSIIELTTVSHLVTEAWMDGDIIYGKVEILPTPHGDTLRNLVEANVTVGISSRGVGTTKSDMNGHQIVQEDFQLICWDFVSEPSTPGGFMMKEGRDLTNVDLKELKKFFDKSDRIDRVVNDILEWGTK
jgi:hypothetical protein